MVFAIIVQAMKATIMTLLLQAGLLLAGGFLLLETDSLDLDVGSYRAVSFTLQEHQATGARLEGSLLAYPDTISVEFLLLHQDDYARWTSGFSPVDTLSQLRVRSGPVGMDVPGFGSLVLVVSNRGNMTAAAVACSLRISFSGPNAPSDPLPSALKMLLLLMTIGVVAAAVGGVLVRELHHRRRKGS